jgi:hypothetical protein
MIWIFGDSFSTNNSKSSWTKQLGYPTDKISHNGISEYRILQNIKAANIQFNDTVIVCHTNPHRVYIPDHISYPARHEQSHKQCDLVISDSMNRSCLWKFISKIYFKYFFDEQHSNEIHNLIILQQMNILKSKTDKIIEVSGFEGQPNSFHDVYESNPGGINHMNALGNEIVAQRIKDIINVKIS